MDKENPTHELTFGVLSRREAMEMMDNGSCRIHTVLTVDSMSLWSAIAAAVVKVPTEKNMAVHLFWLRELLTTGAIKILRWCDTRDMTADCQTKGSIGRTAILELMKGNFAFEHEVKDYEVKVKRPSTTAIRERSNETSPADVESIQWVVAFYNANLQDLKALGERCQ